MVNTLKSRESSEYMEEEEREEWEGSLQRGRNVPGKENRMCNERQGSIEWLGEYREWRVVCRSGDFLTSEECLFRLRKEVLYLAPYSESHLI